MLKRALALCLYGLLSPPAPAQSRFSSHNFPFALPCGQEAFREHLFNLDEPLSTNNAVLTTMASYLVEQPDPEQIKAQLARWGFMQTILFGINRTGVFGYVSEHDQFILVEIRGTINWEEWFKDSMLIPIPAPQTGFPGRIHAGMLLHYHLVTPLITAALNQLDPQHQKPLVVAGHSLGGAIAHLVALRLVADGYPLQALYTTAQPRLGDETLVNYAGSILADRSLRLSVIDDPAPRLPPDARNAEPFSHLLPPQLAHVRPFIQRFTQRLGYHAYAGKGWIIPAGGEPLIAYNDEWLAEREFWLDFQGEVSGASLPAMMQAWHTRLGHHNPGVYTCRLLSSLESSP